MHLTLAYHWLDPEGVEHAPDETIEVEDDVLARQLLREGKARDAITEPADDADMVDDPPADPPKPATKPRGGRKPKTTPED